MPPHTGSPPQRPTRRRGGSQAIVVREATPDDRDAIVGLRMALLREESRSPLFAEPHPDAEARTFRVTTAQLMDAEQVFLLATSAGEIVGALRCTITAGAPVLREAARGFLTAAYVRPQFRRKGVLRLLVDAAAAWCAARDVHDLRLHCTRENVEGNAAWEALGFEVVEVVRRRRGTP
jgi:ribosomal protein S18 acetylase RimI-like enzyme